MACDSQWPNPYEEALMKETHSQMPTKRIIAAVTFTLATACSGAPPLQRPPPPPPPNCHRQSPHVEPDDLGQACRTQDVASGIWTRVQNPRYTEHCCIGR